MCEQADATETLEGDGAGEAAVMTEEERKEKRLEDGIGLPNIVVDCSERSQPFATSIVESGKLPSVEEVTLCEEHRGCVGRKSWKVREINLVPQKKS